MVELSALALACEKTRVLSFMFSLPAAHVYYRHLAPDMNDDFHDTICHGDAGDQSNQPRVDAGVQYTMRCLNELSEPEGHSARQRQPARCVADLRHLRHRVGQDPRPRRRMAGALIGQGGRAACPATSTMTSRVITLAKRC